MFRDNINIAISFNHYILRTAHNEAEAEIVKIIHYNQCPCRITISLRYNLDTSLLTYLAHLKGALKGIYNYLKFIVVLLL